MTLAFWFMTAVAGFLSLTVWLQRKSIGDYNKWLGEADENCETAMKAWHECRSERDEAKDAVEPLRKQNKELRVRLAQFADQENRIRLILAEPSNN